MSDLIRFSEVNVDRLNKAMLQLKLQMDTLQRQIDALKEAQAKTVASVPGYPGIENGSVAIIQGPPPGGPSPLPPWLVHHSMFVGEGSTPVKQIVGTDGQVPIACTGNDPAFANIQGEVNINGAYGFAIQGTVVVNNCNSIEIGLAQSIVNWLILASTLLGIGAPVA